MPDDELLRHSFTGVELNDDYSQAIVALTDGSRLEFLHRVSQRTVKAIGAPGPQQIASQVLARITRFRLNGKHLEIFFADRSHWEVIFGAGR